MRHRRHRGRADAELVWEETSREPLTDDIWSVTLHTNRGDVITRYHPVPGAAAGVVWVGGAGGGLEGPAHGLYPEGCRRLRERGVAGLRLHYRRPNEIEECVLDTLLGVEFLGAEGVERVALIGHSFGGAVVIAAGALSERVRAVVPMSTQTYGTGLAPQVSPRAMLLIHGTEDAVLPDTCSRQVYRMAGEPKKLVLYPGAGHGLDEVREELLDLLVRWLPERLGIEEAASPASDRPALADAPHPLLPQHQESRRNTMSDRANQESPERKDEFDPALERIQEDRKPGEIETGMASGSDEGDISATERFEGELTREEALQVLAPDREEEEAEPARPD